MGGIGGGRRTMGMVRREKEGQRSGAGGGGERCGYVERETRENSTGVMQKAESAVYINSLCVKLRTSTKDKCRISFLSQKQGQE